MGRGKLDREKGQGIHFFGSETCSGEIDLRGGTFCAETHFCWSKSVIRHHFGGKLILGKIFSVDNVGETISGAGRFCWMPQLVDSAMCHLCSRMCQVFMFCQHFYSRRSEILVGSRYFRHPTLYSQEAVVNLPRLSEPNFPEYNHLHQRFGEQSM